MVEIIQTRSGTEGRSEGRVKERDRYPSSSLSCLRRVRDSITRKKMARV